MRLLLGFVLVVGACAPQSQIRRFEGPDSPPVEVGHYQLGASILYGPGCYDRLVHRLRADAEAREALLRRIVREHIDLKSPLEFEFKYAAVDTEARIVLLRYFAPHPSPFLIAGWQVQLVYRLSDGVLERTYVEEVPLE